MYEVWWNLSVKGVIETKDVIGSLYHETESLEPRFNLEKLEEEEKIDGISLSKLESENGMTKGVIKIRVCSSFDAKGVAEIAAALETIKKIGPCESEIEVDKIKRTNPSKHRYVKQRAQELVKEFGLSRGVKS